MKKLYFDSEYNDCACAEPKDRVRVPAEKPFEAQPRHGNRHSSPQRRKQRKPPQSAPVAYPSIPPGYCLYPCPDPEYRPRFRLSFDEIEANPTVPMMRAKQRNFHTMPPQKEYVSSSSEERTYPVSYDKRRVLGGQYPCDCMQLYSFPSDPKCPQACIYECMPTCNPQKCPPCKRAWDTLKQRARNFFGFGSSPRNSNKQKQNKTMDFYDECCNPYLYPQPQPVRYVPYPQARSAGKGYRHQASGTHAHFKGQSMSSMESARTKESYGAEKAPSLRQAFEEVPQFTKWPKPVSRADCCCVCDVDFCECRCCCTGNCDENNLYDSHQHTQTSMQNIKERFTQTDFPKKCCRCCPCCRRKVKCNPLNFPDLLPSSHQTHPGKCVGCDPCPYKPVPCPPTPNFSCNNQKGEPSDQNRPTNETPKTQMGKTQMVKTNSVQCIPMSENKGTSCDEHFTATRVNDLLKELWDGKYDVNYDGKPKRSDGDVPIYKSTIEWTNSFLKSMKPHLVDDGIFSSPLTGKNYNLCLHEVKSSQKLIGRRLPKPFDLTDGLFNGRLSRKLHTSHDEHTKLISTICDAILSKHDEELSIGMAAEETITTPREGNTKTKIPKPKLLKSKKKGPERKQTTTSKIASPKEKVALDEEASKFDGTSNENFQSKHFNERCRTPTENQKGNQPIDYDRLKHLDFSSIRFTKPEASANASEFFHQKYLNQKNFILNNLPSYSSSISNEYQVKSLLLNSSFASPGELLENTTSPPLHLTPPDSSSRLDCKNKIQSNVEEKLQTLRPCERALAEKKIDLMLAEIERRGKDDRNRDVEFFGKKW